MTEVDGKPVVPLVSDPATGGFAGLAGVWQGQVRIADDFDQLPEDLAERLGMAE